MNNLLKVLGPALIVGGVWMLYMGHQASKSVASRVGTAITGEPSDASMKYYGGGAVLIVLGLGAGGVSFRKK